MARTVENNIFPEIFKKKKKKIEKERENNSYLRTKRASYF